MVFLAGFFSASAQNASVLDSLERKLPEVSASEKPSILYELVYGYLRIDIQKANLFHDKVIAELRQDHNASSLSYLWMADGIYQSRTGHLDSGIVSLEKAKTYALESNAHDQLVKIYAALGHSHISSGKPERGLENMFAGLRILEQYPDKEMEYKLRTNVAWAYLELKQYRNCIQHGLENLRMMEGTQYEWIALYTYNNVAVSYGAIGLLDSAKYFIDKGIRGAEKNNDEQSLANGYFILGTIYANANKYELAIEQYLKARPHREKVGNPLFIVSDLYAMSELYYKTKEYKKGVDAGLEALKLAEKYNLTLKFEGTYASLAQNYEGLGDFKSSSKYNKLWAAAKDSIYKNASATSIAEMETRFETEKKEQQLALQNAELLRHKADLQKTYVIIVALLLTLIFITVLFLVIRNKLQREKAAVLREAQIQATIQSQENERRRFAQDLHDGMGQLISALRLAILSIHKESTLQERVHVVSKAEKLLNDMHTEIRSVAFNLMPQTLVQNGLIPALKEMAIRVNDSGKINIRVNGFDIPERLAEIQEISLYRIIQEWVNNVIKYSEATQIEIQFVGYPEEISVTVEDNGKGFDPATLGLGKGNGWKNIRSRANLVKGAIDIDSRPGHQGTTLMITLPVRNQHFAAATVSTNTQQHG